MSLSGRDDLIAALSRLGQLADEDGETIELLIVGGGVMVLAFGTRLSTRDLDGIVLNSIEPSKVRQYTAKIALERGWPSFSSRPASAISMSSRHAQSFKLRSALTMRRLRDMCEAESPAPLKSRNFFAPANYLIVK